MSINYPTSLDTLTNPNAADPLNSPSHSTQHADANDAIEALETKVGVNSSAVTTSLDYLVKNTSSSDPGHKHTLANGATDVTASAAEVNKLDGVTATTTELNYVDVATPGTAEATKAVILDANKDFNFGTGDITATVGTFISINSTFSQGTLINGQITTSVSSNNLTVALKTLAGSDPSATDPIYVRIGNSIRSITSSRSVTKNAGTNWGNIGASETAAKENDWFAYVAWDSANSTVRLGFCRYPCFRLYSSFSATTTAEKYGAFDTAPGSSDEVEVIGRFNATLSASASYNWSIPATSVIVNRPIFETRWLAYQPTYAGTGSMTYTSVTTTQADYRLDRDMAYIRFNVTGTTGGVAADSVSISIPITPTDTPACHIGTGYNSDSGYVGGMQPNAGTPSTITTRRVSGGNYALAAGKQHTGFLPFRIF